MTTRCMEMAERYKSVQISMHTFDKDLPLVGNAEYLEIDIDLFDGMSKQRFKEHVLETVERFWSQMQKGQIRKNSKFKFKRHLSVESIGNE